MSLNWDASKIAESVRIGTRVDPYSKEEYEGLSQITETFIWATMAVGIGNLTEAEAPEFYARIRLYEAANGAFLREARKGEDGEPLLDADGNVLHWDERLITEQDVRDHIGLSTNVSKETRAAWLKRFGGFSLDDGVRRYKDTAAEAAKALQTT